MNKLHKTVIGGAILALAALGMLNLPALMAQEGARKRPFAHGDRMAGGFSGAPLITIALNHKNDLNLTSEQVAHLEKIRSHYQSQVGPIQEQLTAVEKEIAALAQQKPADLVQIKTKLQDAEKARSELRYLRLEALENGRSVLTTEQQDQLKTLVRSRHEHFRKQRGQPS